MLIHQLCLCLDWLIVYELYHLDFLLYGAPWNIHGDHADIMSLRDMGWTIGMAENAQEAFDITLQTFAVSKEVNIPFAEALTPSR